MTSVQAWLAFPWLRYVFWLIAGILLACTFQVPPTISMWLGVSSLACFLLVAVLFKQNLPLNQFIWGFLACSSLLLFGFHRTIQVKKVDAPANMAATYWWVELESEAVFINNKKYRFNALIFDEKAERRAIRGMVYAPAELFKAVPQPGERLFVKGRLQNILGPLNPYEFDYRRYLSHQGLHFQLFVVQSVPYSSPATPWLAVVKNAQRAKRYLLSIVDAFLKEQQANAVVKAMVLGNRDGLNLQLREAYANAGVMHILAVSGLHVGMLYLIVSLFFRYMQKSVWQRISWLLLALFILWSYAWLTGLAPSTLRAAIMFSVIVVGRASRRNGNIYNSLAFSAFLLLCWNPLLLMQVGFQLSYLAVLGIVYLQPRIYSWYQPAAYWKKKCWEMFSVSLAAQLATFPLGLLYFQQFPTYFFIGNLLAVPLAFCILYVTLALFLLHLFPFINIVLASLLNLLCYILNVWVNFTDQLPFSKLVATITAVDAVLIYAAIVTVLLMFRFRSFSWGMISAMLLLMLAGHGYWQLQQQKHQRTFTIYQIPGHTLLHFLHGHQEAFLPIGQPPEINRLQYHVEPARLASGFEPLDFKDEKLAFQADFPLPRIRLRGMELVVWHGLRIGIIEGKGENFVVPENSIALDVLLLRQNPALSLEELRKKIFFKQLVLDASNAYWYREKAKIQAKSLHLPFHLTTEQGAYQLKL